MLPYENPNKCFTFFVFCTGYSLFFFCLTFYPQNCENETLAKQHYFLLLLLLFWSFFSMLIKMGILWEMLLNIMGKQLQLFLLSLSAVHVKTNSEDCWWFVLLLFVVILFNIKHKKFVQNALCHGKREAKIFNAWRKFPLLQKSWNIHLEWMNEAY